MQFFHCINLMIYIPIVSVDILIWHQLNKTKNSAGSDLHHVVSKITNLFRRCPTV